MTNMPASASIEASNIFTRFFKNTYGRLTESKWTILFTLAAVAQFVVIFVLQLFILNFNSDELDVIITSDQSTFQNSTWVLYANQTGKIPAGTIDLLSIASDRFARLVLENIFFMVFVFMMGIFGVDGVVRQNTVQLIAYCAICCVNIAFAVTQVGEYVTWKRNLSQVQSDWNISFPLNEVDDARNYACGLIASLVVFMCLFLFLGYKLYLEFGWNIYKRIGADLRMQAIYRTYQIFLVFLKLSPFFQLFFNIFWCVLDFSLLTVIPNAGYSDTHIVVTILNFIFLIWAGIAVRNEHKYPLFGYIIVNIIMFVDFIVIYIIFGTYWVVWDFVIACGMVECVLNIILTVLVIRNFDKGLKDNMVTLAFSQKSQVDMTGINKWAIDDDVGAAEEGHGGFATEFTQIDIERPSEEPDVYGIQQQLVQRQEYPVDLSTQAGYNSYTGY